MRTWLPIEGRKIEDRIGRTGRQFTNTNNIGDIAVTDGQNLNGFVPGVRDVDGDRKERVARA
jgi:hypothetical protein